MILVPVFAHQVVFGLRLLGADQMCGRQNNAGFAPLVPIDPEAGGLRQRIATCDYICAYV